MALLKAQNIVALARRLVQQLRPFKRFGELPLCANDEPGRRSEIPGTQYLILCASAQIHRQRLHSALAYRTPEEYEESGRPARPR
jgi:hypothetical protein